MKALTPEEKAAKIAKMKDLLAARRVARDQDEKVDGVKVRVQSCRNVFLFGFLEPLDHTRDGGGWLMADG